MKPRTKPDFKAIAKLIAARLTDQERGKSVAYLDEDLRPPGRVSIGGEEVKIDHPYVMAFIDERPGSTWMHSCRYLVIDPPSGQIQSIASSRPPLFGALPSTWRVVWKSRGIADWQLLRILGSSPNEAPKR